MKKRNLIVCTLLSMTLAANLILPAMAEETTATQSEGAPAGMQDGGQEGPGGNGGTPPEKPSGAPSGEAPSGAPDGQGGPGAGGTPPEMPSGEAPSGEMPGGPGGMGGQESVTYTAVNEVTEGTQEFSGALESTGTDENVILVSGQDAAASVSGAEVTRTSEDSDSGNTSSFYGNAAALLATDGTLTTPESNVVVENLLGVIFDEEALGMTVVNQWSATTPLNAAGGYWNMFYHFTERYYNDFTEKGIVLMLD